MEKQQIFILLTALPLVLIFIVWYYYLPFPHLTALQHSVMCSSADTSSCEVPPGGFKSWEKGVVTALEPKVERNCTRLFGGDESEILAVKSLLTSWTNTVSDKEILEKTRNCSWVKTYLTDNLYTTKLELSFPIAFIYVVHNSPQQILRLLRFHYRKHNVYCIHPDKKSSKTFSGIFHNMAVCLDNAIIPKILISVSRFSPNIMEAQMICLKELMKFRKSQREREKWKYVINLCGKELPLTTIHGIIEHLTILNGSSLIKTHRMNKKTKLERLRNKIIPFGLPGFKSMNFMALSYKFVNFLLTDRTIQKLYIFFSKNCFAPEEHFFATVYRIPGVPGGYDSLLNKVHFTIDNYLWMVRGDRSCGGETVHDICIVSVTELKEILEKSGDGKWSLFHNKYFMEMDHVVMDCMEERLVARNKIEFKHENSCP